MANASNSHERYEPDLMRLFTADSTIRPTTSFVGWVADAIAIIRDVRPQPPAFYRSLRSRARARHLDCNVSSIGAQFDNELSGRCQTFAASPPQLEQPARV